MKFETGRGRAGDITRKMRVPISAAASGREIRVLAVSQVNDVGSAQPCDLKGGIMSAFVFKGGSDVAPLLWGTRIGQATKRKPRGSEIGTPPL